VPEKLGRFGIKPRAKQLYLEAEGTPRDEIERADVVFETAALPIDDWIYCSVFAQAIQTLHNGCFTRYLSIHLRRAYDVPYASFYEGLLERFGGRPETVLGRVLNRLASLYRAYADDPAIPQATPVASQPDMIAEIERFGRRKGWTPSDWAWLCLASDHERFFEELEDDLTRLGLPLGEEFDELLRYQSEVMLQLDYDPAVGKTCRYDWDFPAYFKGAPLSCRPVEVHYADTHMGVNRQYPIRPCDSVSFAKAAIGESYPFSRIRHFQHQAGAARVRRRTAVPTA
jgi:putative methyltransferase